MKRFATILLLLSVNLFAADTKTISEFTKDMQPMPGYFNMYWDSKAGKIWLEIDKLNTEFLYVHSLPAGIGSNDIGLDRGQLGDSKIVRLERSGPRILLIQPNYSFRDTRSDGSGSRAIQDSFASSVLWGFDVAAEDENKALVDASLFFLNDVHDVASTLKSTKQGDFKLDLSKSAFYMQRTKNFPQNTEVEVTLTFTGEEPGEWVRDVVPTPKFVTVRQHHSFVQLPDGGYTPRSLDPRSGFFGIRYMDFGTQVGDPIFQRFIARHRLQKKDPKAAVSEAVKPIVYYVDSSAPEPIRSALVEGASWWNQAFEAAGYKNAFQVKILPEDVDPLDVRYNVIQWVHRYTRGWSYGNAVIDPRTGEILKGHVTLGSQRVRQDYMIAEGLLAPYEAGKPVPPAMLQMSLARIRQLSAHEVGHTLGLNHNFAASFNDRASVMDYPHPLIDLKTDGTLDFSNAYAKGIGEWDKVTIAYGYSDFPAGTREADQLNSILQKAISRRLKFITDQDARPEGSAHPQAHLWDNGEDATTELLRIFKIRERALANFSEKNIRENIPMSNLEEVLVPVYLFHRYQVTAAAKTIGGLEYSYSMRGDGQSTATILPADSQRKALDAVLSTITPEFLALPERILTLLAPKPNGYSRTRESFNGKTGLTFDALAPAEASANLTVGLILNPQRASRLVEYHARNADMPGLQETIDKLMDASWKSERRAGYPGEIQRTVNNVVLYYLMSLYMDKDARDQVHAITYVKLNQLQQWLSEKIKSETDKDWLAHDSYTLTEIEHFLKDPKEIHVQKPVDMPPGAPIGCD